MKRMSLLLLMLVLAVVLAACSEKENAASNAPTNNGQEAEASEPGNAGEVASDDKQADTTVNDYVFEINGVSIAMHAEAAPILDKLDGPKDYFESEACAFPGLEKVYQFDGFDLYTYEKEGKDYIASVVFFDDTVSTKEGVYLFDKKDNVFNTYGDDYINNLDLYTYEKNGAQLIFLIEDDQVTSIEYLGSLDAY